VVVGSATNYGRSLSSRYAATDLRNQLQDTRGDLVNAGIRRVRVVSKQTTCQRYPLFGTVSGYYTCTTRVRLCGK
jgi:hypothetical protein